MVGPLLDFQNGQVRTIHIGIHKKMNMDDIGKDPNGCLGDLHEILTSYIGIIS